MMFGLNRETDEQSLAAFLEHFAEKQLTEVLIPRMSDHEIDQTLEQLMQLLRKHLSDEEYHKLFLNEEHHH